MEAEYTFNAPTADGNHWLFVATPWVPQQRPRPSVDEEQGSEQKATVACMMYMSLIEAKIGRTMTGEKSKCD